MAVHRNHPAHSRLNDLACWLDRQLPLLRPLWVRLWKVALRVTLRRFTLYDRANPYDDPPPPA
jgi:hypothetical protein